MGHLDCDSWLVHLNEGRNSYCIVTLFRLIESEGVIDKSHSGDNLNINCLINLPCAHQNDYLNSPRLDQKLACGSGSLESRLALCLILEKQC